jgi:hypothetical protein
VATVRRELRIGRPPDEVWAVVGDPTSIASWFPGIVGCSVDGSVRVITTGTGVAIPEEIITNDPILRRFQYRITAPFLRSHLGMIDVFDLGDGTSLVSYSTDALPDAMALIIGGATGSALDGISRVVHERLTAERADTPHEEPPEA